MNDFVFETVKKTIKKLKVNINDNEIKSLIEVPKDYSKGDFAFPCFALAKIMKMPPHEIAVSLRESVGSFPPVFKEISVEGAYLNFFLDRKKVIYDLIKRTEKEKDNFGNNEMGKETVTMIEFSQPNTHKAFHVGHIRGTSIGESLSRISEYNGEKVIRANYSGDTGMHIAKWIWCYRKYHSREEPRDDEKWIASIYVEAIKKIPKLKTAQKEVDEINRKIESKEDPEINALWEKTRNLSIKSWEKIYKELDTDFNVHFFESEVEKRGKEIAIELVKKKIAKIDDGATIIKFEDKNLGTWVLLRKDGTVLYSAKDLALAEIKFKKYNIKKSIYIIGAEQSLHVTQLFKTLELMKFKNAGKCRFIPVSEVRLPTGKMSSRTGDNVLYSEFMEEMVKFAKEGVKKRDKKIAKKELEERALIISIAAIKYSMLKQDSNRNIIFRKEESFNFDGNTGPYLLYSYARASSIINKSKFMGDLSPDFEPEDKETQLALKMKEFPDIVKKSYESLDPSAIANYSYELSKIFNEFYHSSEVLGSDKENFRLHLVNAFRQVLKNSLYLLGIKVLEKM